MKDLTGQRFGRLHVIAYNGRTLTGTYTWLCRCDCGCDTVVSRNNLTQGHTQSCGCLKRELHEQGLFHKTHGQKNTRLYRIWRDMRTRCNNPKANNYHNYGGRGIKCCEEWSKFEPFYAWAIGSGYRDDLTLDRIENDQGYSPNNCKWSTYKEQAANRRERSH